MNGQPRPFWKKRRFLFPFSAALIVFIIVANSLNKGDSTLSPANTETAQTNTGVDSLSTPKKTTYIKIKKYSKLTIDSVGLIKNYIIIKGSTDLPDGANLFVDFDLANTQAYYGSSGGATVKAGHFSAMIKPRQIKELERGPYLTHL